MSSDRRCLTCNRRYIGWRVARHCSRKKKKSAPTAHTEAIQPLKITAELKTIRHKSSSDFSRRFKTTCKKVS